MVVIDTDLNVYIQNTNAAEGTRDPKLFVVESTRVHAKASIWCVNGPFCFLQKGHEVWTAGFFLGFEDEADSRKGHALLLAGLDGKHAGERSVAIVRCASTVHDVSFNFWFVGA